MIAMYRTFSSRFLRSCSLFQANFSSRVNSAKCQARMMLSKNNRPNPHIRSSLFSATKRYQTTEAAQDWSDYIRNIDVIVEQVDLDSDKGQMKVRFVHGESSAYPYIWLRDNCQCEHCFHPTTRSRLVLMMDHDLNIKPTEAKIYADGFKIELIWPDGHKSIFDARWLIHRSFNPNAQKRRATSYGAEHKLWGAEMKENLKYYDYEEVMTDNKAMFGWLCQMETYGLSMLTNAMPEDSVLKLCHAVGMNRRTNYGETFQVQSKYNPNNLAYTNAKLGVHCDLPFYLSVPGIQLLHCVINEVKGGANQFVDASYAAEQLRNLRPDLYDLLCSTLIDYYDIGTDMFSFHMIHRHPIIRRDYLGKVFGITYNNQVRDTFLNVPLEKVAPIYEGLKLMDDIMYDPKNRIDIKLDRGHIAVFDNIRILHGRDKYELDGERFLIGGYMDWCEVRSKIRLLRSNLGIDDTCY